MAEQSDPKARALQEIAVESWRFVRLFSKLLSQLDAGEQGRYQNQIRFFLKKLVISLDSAGLRAVNLEGQAFDPGMAATALNLEDFSEGDNLVVDQMIEPTIMSDQGVLHTGTVVLRRVER